jgi:hypothetical protein
MQADRRAAIPRCLAVAGRPRLAGHRAGGVGALHGVLRRRGARLRPGNRVRAGMALRMKPALDAVTGAAGAAHPRP